LLSYLLNLKPEQLQVPHPDKGPLVIVDDCSLTGARFHQFIDKCQNQQIVFAPLYSHPELRAAIESRESRVVACVSGHDLHDYGPEEKGDSYLAWQELWLGRLEGYRYWVGDLEFLCSAWAEPDHPVWNTNTQQVERGWRIVPPELCLKNGSHHDSGGLMVPVQAEAAGSFPPRLTFSFVSTKG